MPAKRPPEYNLLPTDQDALAREIRKHGTRVNSVLQWRRTLWLLAWYYINGMRRFEVFRPDTREITAFYLDKEDKLEFQSQDLVSALDRSIGQIATMDLRPSVLRSSTSLSLIRDRALAQLTLDGTTQDQHLTAKKQEFAQLYITLGSAGLAGHSRAVGNYGLVTDIEVIHPRELSSFPYLGTDPTKRRGLMRQQLVPLDYLVDMLGTSIKRHVKEMEGWQLPYGTPMEEEFGDGSIGYRMSENYTGAFNTAEGKDKDMDVVRIRQVWIDGPAGMCVRHCLASGDWVGIDDDLSGTDSWCPIGFASCIPSGTFHGIGLFELMFPIAREAEKLMKALFRNVRDLDQLGVVILPSGTYNETAMRDVGRGLHLMSVTPDPLLDNFKPFVIQPWNTGDMPGRTAEFARQVMDRINPIQDLLREKGRVDSASGLQFLDEQIKKAMTNPTLGVEQAWGSMWRSALASHMRSLVKEPKALPVTNMSTELAGAVIDHESGTISFRKNPLPVIRTLQFSVRETSPKSPTARKMEAIELLKLQFTDPANLKLMALKEGLEFAYWDEPDRNAYEQVVRNILSLYNDGMDPGEIVTTPSTARPDLQAMVLDSFMASIYMEVCTPDVVDAFINYKKTLQGFLGNILPEGVPNPDDTALFQQPQMPAPAGMPPQAGQPDQGPFPFPATRTA